jgi:nitrate/TMAO reductase-like tetraheme cytochrome c subunit
MKKQSHLRYVSEYHELYALRKETVERDFADMKEKHGLRWAQKNQTQSDACWCCHEFEKTGELPMEAEAPSFLFTRIISYSPYFY